MIEHEVLLLWPVVFSQQTLNVATPVREVICQMLENYINDDKNTAEIEFPSSLFCHERIFVRQQAQLRNLVCKTLGYVEDLPIAVDITWSVSVVVHLVLWLFPNAPMIQSIVQNKHRISSWRSTWRTPLWWRKWTVICKLVRYRLKTLRSFKQKYRRHRVLWMVNLTHAERRFEFGFDLFD